ncbi:MAG: hypothetical protein NZM31_03715 [Gemmatales bacterium]|nr:hypothetical protein [Gemmatales bacterium]MDW8386107.1 hypothetical protein [Gemmatales bacterium]
MTGDRAATDKAVDDLLRDFFRSEMPQPWPECPVPVPSQLPKAKPSGRLRHSYVGLAACAGFVALGLGMAWNLLRFEDAASAEKGLLPSAAKPIPGGTLFRSPPATLPERDTGRLTPPARQGSETLTPPARRGAESVAPPARRGSENVAPPVRGDMAEEPTPLPVRDPRRY